MADQNDQEDPVELDMDDFSELVPFAVVKRHEWGACEPDRRPPSLLHPLSLVYLSYVNVDDTETAKPLELMRDLQSDDIESGMADIKANFMIAGDGTVYEGRGWNFQPEYIKEYDKEMGNFIEIGFFGDYSKVDTKHPIVIGLFRLLREGIEREFIYEKATFLGLEDMPPLDAIIKPTALNI